MLGFSGISSLNREIPGKSHHQTISFFSLNGSPGVPGKPALLGLPGIRGGVEPKGVLVATGCPER